MSVAPTTIPAMPIKRMAQYFPRRTTLEERDQRRLTLRIPVEIHEALHTLARARYQSMNVTATQALHEFLMREGTWEPVERWLLRTGERYRVAIDGVHEADAAADEPAWPLLS